VKEKLWIIAKCVNELVCTVQAAKRFHVFKNVIFSNFPMVNFKLCGIIIMVVYQSMIIRCKLLLLNNWRNVWFGYSSYSISLWRAIYNHLLVRALSKMRSYSEICWLFLHNINIKICSIELKWDSKITKIWYDNIMRWIRITVWNGGDL